MDTSPANFESWSPATRPTWVGLRRACAGARRRGSTWVGLRSRTQPGVGLRKSSTWVGLRNPTGRAQPGSGPDAAVGHAPSPHRRPLPNPTQDDPRTKPLHIQQRPLPRHVPQQHPRRQRLRPRLEPTVRRKLVRRPESLPLHALLRAPHRPAPTAGDPRSASKMASVPRSPFSVAASTILRRS